MALIAAIPAQAATIYFKNTVGWNTVYVHFYSAKCWDNNQGAGGSGRSEHVSVTPMKIIDGTDIYSCECTGDYSVVAFTKEEQGNYYGFNGNKVVYREDFSTSKPLFTPDNSQSTSLNNCKYYNNGSWSEYSATSTTNGKIYVPVSEYNVTFDAHIYSFRPEIFGNPGTKMTKETVDGTEYWTVAVESSKLPATVEGWILHDGNWTNKATGGDLPGVTFQDGYVYYVNGNSEPLQQQLAAPTFSLTEGTYTGAQSVTISAADGATIYYTTNGDDPTTSSTKYEGAITISTTTTIKAIAVKDGHTSSIASATYTLVEPECWYLPDASTSNAVQMTRNADGSFSLTINIDNDKTFLFSKKNSTATADILGSTAGNNSDYWVKEDKLNHDITLVPGTTQKFIMKAGAGIYKITVSADYSKVKLVNNAGKAGGIPVFPLGVNSEAELSAYDFKANPVYYLLSTILNNNRVTPEWQMTKGADGLYHLNGFAMRNTSCRDTDGNNNVEGYIKVRQYVDATSYEEYDKQKVDNLPTNPLTDGKLYNATFDPSTQKLTLTEDASAKGKMPFISLVGYMMQQDQEYTTPRGIDKKPEGTTTATGWQEAWLQYDANGKLLKDRAGNVMYSTTWPPKNPIYFTATVGENQRLYSSDQMTFVPEKDVEGNYVGKKGSEWEEELKALDPEAYKNLDLVDDNIYYRYVVSDIWYVGAGKIWTGWGSQITYNGNNPIAQWFNHTNWGYLGDKSSDIAGSPIDPEKTYGVSTEEGANGNFLFEEPTYFKTFEFFYENDTPSTKSKIYTTRAYGSASIAAQNVKEGESYKKGSYQAKVTVPEGVTISSWTITRHDATNDALAPIGSDNGKVATYTAEKTDPTSTTFTVDEEGLGEGRYYYELTVTFSNGRTSTVRSNPFVIYFPNQYSVDANGYQLVKLDKATDDGYSYVTYNAKANGDLYFVKFTDSTVDQFRVATSAERESLNSNFAKNEGIKWTDKVFVYAPVPSEFKIDAEKASATVSLDKITSYNVNSTTGIAPVQKELAVVDLKQNFANKVYKAVMNYQQKDPAATVETWNDKISLGKENLTVMRMPNVKGGEVTVTVTPTENNEVLTINYNGTDKKYAANYYNVDVELPFSDPNVEAAVAPQYEVKVTDSEGTTTKLYKASGTDGRAIKFLNVNPLEFAGKSIEVNAKYSDGTGYNLDANLGESAKLASGSVKFTGCTPDFHTLNAIASKAPELDGNGNMIKDDQGYHKQKDVIVVTNLGVSHSGTNDNIGGKTVDAGNALYNADFYLEGAVAYNGVYTIDQLNFAATEEFENGHHVWKNGAIIFDNNTGVTKNPELKVEITPFYVAKVTNTEGTVGLTVPGGSATQGDETYVALTCGTADKQGLQLTTSIVDVTESANVKAYKVIENGEIYIIYGDRKFNVMGAEVK